MITSNIEQINNPAFISDYAVLIKKMRLLRRLNRQQAALLFNFSSKNLERFENGRGGISIEKFKDFQVKYGFSDGEVEALRSGQMKAPTDANSIRKKITTEKRKDRRFCHKRISRECKVLKELRVQKGIDQYSASNLCGFGKRRIGFIENGRVTLNEKLLRQIVESYGFTLEYFYLLMKLPVLRHELIEEGQSLLNQLDDNKLSLIIPMLRSMAS